MLPQRMCVACRERNDKNKLLRIVKVDDEILVDPTHKMQARGVYLCNSTECVRLAQKKRALERSGQKCPGAAHSAAGWKCGDSHYK